jgi:hypothetical protein
MSSNNVDINIRATGAQAAVTSINTVSNATVAAGRTAEQQLERQERARALWAQRAEQQRARAAAHAAADARAAAAEETRLAAAAQRAEERSRRAAAGVNAVGAAGVNTGRAMLSFSQGFEDAQYGIRGVLNNIPGLIMSLGGGAGLTGVISIAAVSLNILWEKFGKVEKKAASTAKALTDYFKDVSQVWEDIESLGDKERDDKRKTDDLSHEKSLASIKFNNSGTLHLTKLDEIRAMGDAENEIARKKLEIMKLESQLALATGKTALELSEARLKAANAIYEVEQRLAEIPREAAMNEARLNVSTAEAVDTANKTRANSSYDDVMTKGEEVANYREEADAIKSMLDVRTQEREAIIANIKAMEDGQVELRRQGKYDLANDQVMLQIPREKARLAKNDTAMGSLGKDYASKQAQGDAAEASLAKASTNLEATSKAQEKSSTALMEAVSILRQLKQTQEVQGTVANERKITDAKTEIESTGKTVTDAATRAIDDIQKNANDQGRGQNPAEQEAIGRLKGLVGDNVSDAEQGQTLASILQGLANSLTQKDAALARNIESLIEIAKGQVTKINEQLARIKALEAQANQKK